MPRLRKGSTSLDSYTLDELAKHWGLSRGELAARLCNASIPVYFDGARLDVSDAAGRPRRFRYRELLRLPDLERVRGLIEGPNNEELVELALALNTSSAPEYIALDTRQSWRQRLRAKREDVDAYDSRRQQCSMPARGRAQKRQSSRLPALPSFSLRQLAERWKCSEQDVIEYIITGALHAHVLLSGWRGTSAKTGAQVFLKGHYGLPLPGADDVLTRPRPKATLRMHPLDLVAGDGEVVTIDRLFVRPGDVRVLRQGVERFEAAMRRGEKTKGPLKRMLSDAGRLARADQRAKAAPVHAAVRVEFKRLLAEGYGPTKAAQAIVSEGAAKARIQTIADQRGIKPWRGNFYSYGAVRKIVGL